MSSVNPSFLNFIAAKTGRPAEQLGPLVEQKTGRMELHSRGSEEAVRSLGDVFEAQAPVKKSSGSSLLDAIDMGLNAEDAASRSPKAASIASFITNEASTELHCYRGSVTGVESNPEHTLCAVNIGDSYGGGDCGTVFVHAEGSSVEWYIHSPR